MLVHSIALCETAYDVQVFAFDMSANFGVPQTFYWIFYILNHYRNALSTKDAEICILPNRKGDRVGKIRNSVGHIKTPCP